MAAQEFFLAGDAPSTAVGVDMSNVQNLESLKATIAGAYSIVEPSGKSPGIPSPSIPQPNKSQANGHELDDLKDVQGATGKISVNIDGHSVREVPGPKGLPFLGTYLEIYPDHLGNNRRFFNKYGPMFKTSTMGMDQIQCNEPELALIALSETEFFTKQISTIPDHPLHAISSPDAGVFLSDTDNPSWRIVHKFLPPALGPKAVRHYAPLMNRTVDKGLPILDQLEQSKEAWNVYQFMVKLGAQAVAELMLDMDFKHFESVDSPLHPMVLAMAETLSLNKKISTRGAWYASLPFGDPERLRSIQNYMQGEVDAAIERAKSTGNEDLPLQDAALHAANVIDYLARATDNDGNKLPKQNLVAACLVAYGAGFTTTSTLLSWLVFCMVTYDDVQDRLVQDLVDGGYNDGEDITPELIENLTYLDKFVKETQRIHNPSYQPGRTARKDCILPGGYRIHKDDVIISAIHHIHTNPKHWENAERFDPDRWDTPAVKNRHKAQYLPFATGQRMCIGFNFALQEAKVFLCKLVWHFKWFKEGESAVEYDPFFQLIRPVNLYAKTEKRTEYPSKSSSVQS